jgi:hypothetical protein
MDTSLLHFRILQTMGDGSYNRIYSVGLVRKIREKNGSIGSWSS